MTCDPNALSQLSSCLRCLTNGQLFIVRTFLLCRWAQVAKAVTPNLLVISTPGGITYQIIADDLGDLGTVAGSGVVTPLLLASMPSGIIYQIVVDDLGDLGTVAASGVGQNLTLKSTPGGIAYRIIADDGGNLGTL